MSINNETVIKCEQKTLNAYVAKTDTPKKCVLFLPGGGVNVGMDRFRGWQDDLASLGISSVSFNYSGVNGSGDSIDRSSLQSRVGEAACVSNWMKENVVAEEYILYGVSMGGYIALALVNEIPEMFQKLILQAPAAYSSVAHNINFGEQFSNEIRKEGSWKNSESFEWLEKFKKPTLFIELEKDEIILAEIISRYKSMKTGDDYFKPMLIKGVPHDVWSETEEDKKFRNEIFNEISSFINR